MNVLVVIPHHHNPDGGGAYGSTGPGTDRRAACLAECLLSLHSAFGPRQAFLHHMREHVPGKGNGAFMRVNSHAAGHLDVVVCTPGERHLLGHEAIPAGLHHHVRADVEPMLTGFACHRILEAHLGKYDFYCYLEDDLAIRDSMFLEKVGWFSSTFGDDNVLFPHRFETSTREPLRKLYIDGPVKPNFSAKWQDVNDSGPLRASFGMGDLVFERWTNPHSGCFFLNARQMDAWAASEDFRQVDCSFAGPLESAASLGVMKHFRIHKPAAANAGFLEVHHLHNRYLGESLKMS